MKALIPGISASPELKRNKVTPVLYITHKKTIFVLLTELIFLILVQYNTFNSRQKNKCISFTWIHKNILL